MQAFLWVVPFSTNLGLSLWWENTVGRGPNLPSWPSNNQPPHKSALVLEQLDPRLSQYAASCSTSSDLIEKRGLPSTCTFLRLSLSNKWQSLPTHQTGKAAPTVWFKLPPLTSPHPLSCCLCQSPLQPFPKVFRRIFTSFGIQIQLDYMSVELWYCPASAKMLSSPNRTPTPCKAEMVDYIAMCRNDSAAPDYCQSPSRESTLGSKD